MSAVRRFRLAPSLARLIRKERGATRIIEGFFPPQSGRTSLVRVEGAQCHLILITTDGSGATTGEERTEVPRAHGDALLDVCAGKAVYDRATLALGAGREALVDRFTTPAALDLVSIGFEKAEEAGSFVPPAWFGAEVTGETAYESRTLALQGVPSGGEVPLTNAALDAVLDLLEPRFGLGRYGAVSAPRPAAAPVVSAPSPAPVPAPREPEPAAPAAEDEDEVMTALRRLAVSVGPNANDAAPKPAPTPSEPAPAPADARLDDVIESLSQALGTVAPPQADQGEAAAGFERWTIRPRRQGS